MLLPRTKAMTALLYLLVVGAGVAALSWEVLWQLQASLAIGVSAVGTAITLAATMGGVTLGALAAGRFFGARANRYPLRTYGLLEIAIGLSGGALLLPGFRELERLDAATFARSPTLAPLVHVAGIFLLIAPASIAMGATVPCLGLVARRRGVSLTALYAANTAGAAVGSLVVSFVLLPRLGVEVTALALAAIDLLVAAGAWLLPESGAEEPAGADGVPANVVAPVRTEMLAPSHAYASVLVTGFVTFGLEVAWFRALRAVFTSTTQTFAILLVSILVPLAIGGRIAGRGWVGRQALGVTLAAAGALAIATTAAIERFGALFIHFLVAEFWVHTAASLTITMLVLGPSMALIGVCLPWVLQRQDSPARWGRLYAANTVGAVLGSLLTAWVLLPRLGFARTVWVLGGASLVLGATVVRRRSSVWVALSGAAALAVGAIWDTHLGVDRLLSSFDTGSASIVAYREGPESTVAVMDSGGVRSLLIDGFLATDESGGAHYMSWMGRLPVLLSAHPDRALVICFGTGQTAHGVRAEGAGAIDIVELNPNVLGLASLFASNHGVLQDPRVQAITMDGRAWLRRTDRTYDVVTLEPMPPNFAGVNSLYSREFYEFVARRLRPGGVVAQWVPFHLVTPHDAVAIAATFQSVFPDAMLWIDPVDKTGIVVGRLRREGGPLGSRWPGLDRQAESDRDLTRGEIVGASALTGDAFERYASYGQIVTDDNQLLAYGPERNRLPFLSSGPAGLHETNLRLVGAMRSR